MCSLLSSITIQKIHYIISIMFHFVTAGLAIWFFKSKMSEEQKKISIEKRNFLLNNLIKQYKNARNSLEKFFCHNFESDEDLKKYRFLIVEEFTTISSFIESIENIIVFDEKEIKKLIKPNHILNKNNLFASKEPLATLRNSKSELSQLRSEVSQSIIDAYRVCWLRFR